MADQSLVSIVIPCYNHGQYVAEAIESALLQTYPHTEIIVINDGSTDRLTREFFRNYYHPRVKLVTTKNQGLPTARDTAINLSSGEFFVPLDADDKLHPEFIARTLPLTQDPKVGVVYTDQEWFGTEAKQVRMREFDPSYLLVENHVSVCSLIRRSAFDQVKSTNGYGYNPNMKYGYEDWDLWISLSELSWQFRQITEPLFYYRRASGSMIERVALHHGEMISQLIENHKQSYYLNHHQVIVELQKLLLDKGAREKAWHKSTNSKVWIVKRWMMLVKQLLNK